MCPEDEKKTGKKDEARSVPETKQREQYARAAHEDDDGYDPWSDRRVSEPLWEEDPWS